MVAGLPCLQRPFLPLEQRLEKMTQQQSEGQEVRFKTQRGRKHVSTSANSLSKDGKKIRSLVSKHRKIKAVKEENKEARRTK